MRVDDGRGDGATSPASSFRITTLGDENGDGTVNVLDVLMLINFVFRGGSPPNPKSIGDVNGDCVINVLDVVYLIGHVFRGGPTPVAGYA